MKIRRTRPETQTEFFSIVSSKKEILDLNRLVLPRTKNKDINVELETHGIGMHFAVLSFSHVLL
jgi:hypothetical protein